MYSLQRKRGILKMDKVIFVVAYLALLLFVAIVEIYFLTNNKGAYLKTSYNALKEICQTYVEKKHRGFG